MKAKKKENKTNKINIYTSVILILGTLFTFGYQLARNGHSPQTFPVDSAVITAGTIALIPALIFCILMTGIYLGKKKEGLVFIAVAYGLLIILGIKLLFPYINIFTTLSSDSAIIRVPVFLIYLVNICIFSYAFLKTVEVIKK